MVHGTSIRRNFIMDTIVVSKAQKSLGCLDSRTASVDYKSTQKGGKVPCNDSSGTHYISWTFYWRFDFSALLAYWRVTCSNISEIIAWMVLSACPFKHNSPVFSLHRKTLYYEYRILQYIENIFFCYFPCSIKHYWVVWIARHFPVWVSQKFLIYYTLECDSNTLSSLNNNLLRNKITNRRIW